MDRKWKLVVREIMRDLKVIEMFVKVRKFITFENKTRQGKFFIIWNRTLKIIAFISEWPCSNLFIKISTFGVNMEEFSKSRRCNFLSEFIELALMHVELSYIISLTHTEISVPINSTVTYVGFYFRHSNVKSRLVFR